MNKKVRNLLVFCAVVLLGLVGTVSAVIRTSSWRAVYWNNDSRYTDRRPYGTSLKP